MRKPFTLSVLVAMTLAALVSAVFAESPPVDTTGVVLTFRHRNENGVRFEVRFEDCATDARYEAYLGEGEHVTERDGRVRADRWRALVATTDSLIAPGMDPAISDADACWEVTLQRAGIERTARFRTASSPREKRLLQCFDRTALPGRIYDQLINRNPSS